MFKFWKSQLLIFSYFILFFSSCWVDKYPKILERSANRIIIKTSELLKNGLYYLFQIFKSQLINTDFNILGLIKLFIIYKVST